MINMMPIVKKVFLYNFFLICGLMVFNQNIHAQEKEKSAPKAEKTAAPLDLEFGGMLQIRYFYSGEYQTFQGGTKDASTTIQLKRAEVAVSGSIHKTTSFKLMLDTARYPGVFNTPTDRASLPLQDVFIDYKYIPFMNIRTGQFFTPVTMESLQPSGKLYFIERATHTGGGTLAGGSPGTSAYGDKRDIGIMPNFQFGKLSAPYFEYAIGIFQGASQNNVEQDRHKSLSTKIDIRPTGKSLTIGFSAQRDSNPLRKDRKDRVGGHLLFLLSNLTIAIEGMQGWDLGKASRGVYGAILYKMGLMEPGIRADIFFRDVDGANKKVMIITTGLNYNVFKHSRLQFNYVYVNDESPDIVDHQLGINTQVTF